MNRFSLIPIVVLLSCISCKNRNTLFELKDPNQTGIHFINQVQNTPELNILNYLYFYNGAGVATADFNGDGLIDIYFSSNMGADRMYINQGKFNFKDITLKAGIENDKGWTMGVSVTDINHDGKPDLYLSKVHGHLMLEGPNLLFENQGNDSTGIPRFKEVGAKYGLNLKGYGTQAAFFDKDGDGDLDMYQLNHSLHPNRTYGNGLQRQITDSLAGDKLMINTNNLFQNVASQAGIYTGKSGYGLGISLGDLNIDGYIDLYVGNDFYENDYLYYGKDSLRFTDKNHRTEWLGHTSHYSMGNDMADLNNDLLPEILSVDMLSADLITLKSSAPEFNYQYYLTFLKQGYSPQYMQNTLHRNLGKAGFSEVAFQAGVAATDWSWSVLAADFDLDGFRDLHITNGIPGATNDMDFINFIANDEIQTRLGSNMTQQELKFIAKMPEKKTTNYFFKNVNGWDFENVSNTWSSSFPSYSMGAAYADLDNDGDLDIVINNLNAPASILENKAEVYFPKRNWIQFAFQGPSENPLGIGTRIHAYHKDLKWSATNFPVRGYLSSVSPDIHLGLGNVKILDSVEVYWPDGKKEVFKSIATNKKYSLVYGSGLPYASNTKQHPSSPLNVHIDTITFWSHTEQETLEFTRDPLIPYGSGNEGPAMDTGDINNDGLEDLVIGGGKMQAPSVFLAQKRGGFQLMKTDVLSMYALHEDTAVLLADLNKDGLPDLIIGSGGNEFRNGEPLQPRVYWNNQGLFDLSPTLLSNAEGNCSSISARDINDDGLPDLLFTYDQLAGSYGETPPVTLLLQSKDRKFLKGDPKITEDLQNLGGIKEVVWADLNGDDNDELILTGHWMPISIFHLDKNKFSKLHDTGFEQSSGWWNCLISVDLDNDGDLDVIAGNWGANSKLKASKDTPVTLYLGDLDENGKVDPILTYFHNNIETTFASKEELSKQLPYLNKKYLSFRDFARASIQDIFENERLKKAQVKKVTELKSAWFENDGLGHFTLHYLPEECQVSPIMAMTEIPNIKKGITAVLMGGNSYEVSTQIGRMDALPGVVFYVENGSSKAEYITSLDLKAPVRSLIPIRYTEKNMWIAGINGGSIKWISKSTSEQ